MPKHVLHFNIGFYRVVFLLFLPIFSTTIKNFLSQWESVLHWILKSRAWLQLFFHFGSENREEQFKKPPCMLNSWSKTS